MNNMQKYTSRINVLLCQFTISRIEQSN